MWRADGWARLNGAYEPWGAAAAAVRAAEAAEAAARRQQAAREAVNDAATAEARSAAHHQLARARADAAAAARVVEAASAAASRRSQGFAVGDVLTLELDLDRGWLGASRNGVWLGVLARVKAAHGGGGGGEGGGKPAVFGWCASFTAPGEVRAVQPPPPRAG